MNIYLELQQQIARYGSDEDRRERERERQERLAQRRKPQPPPPVVDEMTAVAVSVEAPVWQRQAATRREAWDRWRKLRPDPLMADLADWELHERIAVELGISRATVYAAIKEGEAGGTFAGKTRAEVKSAVVDGIWTCKHSHQWVDAELPRQRNGTRRCPTCRKAEQRQYNAKRREQERKVKAAWDAKQKGER